MINYQASCHCGSVQITVGHQPEFINNCNCSLCSKAGALWGYYNTKDIEMSGETRSYLRKDKPAAVVEVHACKVCASTTHSLFTEEYQKSSGITDRMGINMRLFNRDDLVGVEMRFPDGKSWPGEGEFVYRKQPIIIEPLTG
ncbi:GFA family protein [Parasphingorhabdus sp.]|uniref:GFA family protein n=1 Tax=Parasphingorhabdus sp. TaxID=2709688 RepID=UPI003BAE61A2